jgi:hypothetical protein
MSTPETNVSPNSNSIDRVFSHDNFLTIFVTLIGDANALLEQSGRAEVTNIELYGKGIDAVKICNTVLNRIEDRRREVVDPVNQRVKWFNSEVAKIVETVEQAKTSFANKTLAFKKTEDLRLAAEAEKQRKLAEDQAIRDAEAATAAGDKDRADKLLAMAAETPRASSGLKGRGSFTGASGGSKKRWVGEVVDVKAFCKAVAAGEIPESYIKEISKSKLNTFADDKKTEGVFYGIKCREEETLNVR